MRRCVGAEALLRWLHPKLGDVLPAEFMLMIEKTSLARPTTRSAIEMRLRRLGAWRRQGIGITLSINFLATNLSETDFAHRVQLSLLEHGVRPEMLDLEVTESAMMEDAARSLEQLATIDEASIAIAIDDFGTGHSSLAYLQRLPAKILKIDQSFVRDLMLGERERPLVRLMISLAHELDYRVVAEGIGTPALLRPSDVSGGFEGWFAGERMVTAGA